MAVKDVCCPNCESQLVKGEGLNITPDYLTFVCTVCTVCTVCEEAHSYEAVRAPALIDVLRITSKIKDGGYAITESCYKCGDDTFSDE